MLCDRWDSGLVEVRRWLLLLVRSARGDAGRLKGSGDVERSEQDIVVVVTGASNDVPSRGLLSQSALRLFWCGGVAQQRVLCHSVLFGDIRA